MSIIKRSRTPSVLRVYIYSMIEEIFNSFQLSCSCSHMQRSTLIIVTLLKGNDSSLDEEIKDSYMTARSSLASSNHGSDLSFIRSRAMTHESLLLDRVVNFVTFLATDFPAS